MSRVIENPKQLILVAAKHLLFDKGYTELNMRSIAKDCGIAIGTIYNYFPTKKDLVMEMMSGYWEECFHCIDEIIDSKDTFYIKLNKTYLELGNFIKTFKEVWLRPELYREPDYLKNGLARENLYMERLIRKIEAFMLAETSKPNSEIKLKLSSYETSKFITMNFITLIQMPFFTYSSFETFLKELLA